MTHEDLYNAFLAAAVELEHEIARVHRRINSDEEKDRRDYLEGWIADFRRQQRGCWRGSLAERRSSSKGSGQG